MVLSDKSCNTVLFIADLIQKLIDSGKQLLAIKYIFEFELADKYPPVPLLEAYVNETKKLAENLCREKKNTLGAQVIFLSLI